MSSPSPGVTPEKGVLLMLATHIGNIDDMPVRSKNALKEADLLVFEEDRPARRALKAAKVHREYLKFSEHDQKETLDDVRRCLKKGGTVAYMSDQGCPVLADPGQPLVEMAWELQAQVKVVPGPSSLTAAMAACPFPMESFYHAGFLPRDKGVREREIQELLKRKEALVLMDTPYRLGALLKALTAGQSLKRKGFLALDITGPSESYHYGPLNDLAKRFSKPAEKLNFVLILAPLPAQSQYRKPLRQGKKASRNTR